MVSWKHFLCFDNEEHPPLFFLFRRISHCILNQLLISSKVVDHFWKQAEDYQGYWYLGYFVMLTVFKNISQKCSCFHHHHPSRISGRAYTLNFWDPLYQNLTYLSPDYFWNMVGSWLVWDCFLMVLILWAYLNHYLRLMFQT